MVMAWLAYSMDLEIGQNYVLLLIAKEMGI